MGKSQEQDGSWRRPGRHLAAALVAVALSACMVVAVGARLQPAGLADLYWADMAVQGAPAARLLTAPWGGFPPAWARGLAVAWQSTDLLAWWWLPLLLLGLRWAVMGRRRGDG